MASPLHFDWFQRLSIKLKIVSIAGILWLSIVAWPMAVAAIFAAIVLNSLQDRKAALVLVSAMAVPALLMEGVWASMLIGGVYDRQKEVELTYSVGQQEAAPTIAASVRGTQDTTPTPTVRVLSALSGDTLEVSINGETDQLRLIGVNAPSVNLASDADSECFGLESYMFLNSLLSNQAIEIDSDAALGDRDVDGSLLRYVSLKDGTSVNELMLEAGLAQSEQNLGYRKQDAYLSLAVEAESENKGLWASCNADGTPKVTAESDSNTSPGDNGPIQVGDAVAPTPAYIQPTAVPTVQP